MYFDKRLKQWAWYWRIKRNHIPKKHAQAFKASTLLKCLKTPRTGSRF